MAKSERKTRIAEDWQPDDPGREFAAANGVPDTEIGAFVDYHLAKGDTMASWPAAWRTWCRNAVKFGSASGRRGNAVVSLVAGSPLPDDPWGAKAWGQIACQSAVGFDLCSVVLDICEAADIPKAIRPELDLIPAWLNLVPTGWYYAGQWPDMITAAIRSAQRRPDRPNLRWYDGLVRQLADRKRA